jgi:hypothetical protein
MDKIDINMAKVGLRALIDEATEFQKVRDKDDLHKYVRQLRDKNKEEDDAS